MSTINSERPSAIIIQFPVGARAIGGGRRDANKAAAHYMPQRVKVASGGAWYHEEAIREDELTSAR